MRRYEQSHPWINFDSGVILNASYKLWLALGEARSKCEHIAMVPMPPDEAKKLQRIYLAKGVWATNAIEGNTLSEEDVQRRISGDLKLPPSQEYLGQETDNVAKACNETLEQLYDDDFCLITPDIIKQANRRILDKLSLDGDIIPGEFRSHAVGVADYLGAPAEDCEYLVDRMCAWLNEESFRPNDEMKIAVGIIRAVLAHLYLVWIHPFGDGNGRASRLLELRILLSAGVPAPAAHLLSNHYNKTRQAYYRHLRESSKKNSPMPFLEYAVQGFVDGLKVQIDMIRNFQWNLTWKQYVYDFFDGKKGAMERRRDLLLGLSTKNEVVSFQNLRNIPQIARKYATTTDKTMVRDLNYLIKEDFVERSANGYRAMKEEILYFLPIRRLEPEEGGAEE